MIRVINCKSIIKSSPNAPFIVVCPNCGSNNEFYGYTRNQCDICNKKDKIFTDYIKILRDVNTRLAYYNV